MANKQKIGLKMKDVTQAGHVEGPEFILHTVYPSLQLRGLKREKELRVKQLGKY